MSDVTKITVNGREYDSVEQMPPDVREEYEQAMAQLQKAGAFKFPGLGKIGTTKTVVSETITYNGREYASRDELPPEARELLEKMPAAPGDPGTAQETITYNGREYTSRDELPTEARALLEKFPESSTDHPTSDVKIETVQTFPAEEFIIRSFHDREKAPAPERDPKIAWLLVSILTVVVVVLLFLLYLSGARRH